MSGESPSAASASGTAGGERKDECGAAARQLAHRDGEMRPDHERILAGQSSIAARGGSPVFIAQIVTAG